MALGRISELVFGDPQWPVEAVVLIGAGPVPVVNIGKRDVNAETARRLAAAIVKACDRAEELAEVFEDGLPRKDVIPATATAVRRTG